MIKCLQPKATGQIDTSTGVDNYLRNKVENGQALPKDLRICAGRIARAMYTLRNHRNIAHIGDVDPNKHDLTPLHQSALWIMAELSRCASTEELSLEETGFENLKKMMGG